MTADNALELIREDLNSVEKALLENINSSVPLINEVVSYLLSSGGKRLRPAFVILSSKMCGYSGEKAVMLSTVIEYIHTATLLHDDIIDGAKYRRGLPCANEIYGSDIAVLCGDFLYSRGYITLTKWGDNAIQRLLSSVAMIMSEGEALQLLKTADINITMEDYLRIIESKTGVLFSASCEIGARLAGLDEDKCASLAAFGRDLGLAFQMSDDILDYLGNQEKTGKAPGTDLKEGKLTLPVILLIKNSTGEEKKNISRIFTSEDRNEDDLNYIISLMKKYSIKEKSENIMMTFISDALSRLESFPPSKYRDAMAALSKAMIHRQK